LANSRRPPSPFAAPADAGRGGCFNPASSAQLIAARLTLGPLFALQIRGHPQIFGGIGEGK
jgi:hypothetical protein